MTPKLFIAPMLLLLLASPVQLHAQDCPSGLTDCNGSCVDLLKDEVNCGDCDVLCFPGYICENGNCVLSCQTGLTDCNGICVDTDSDEENCGQCGRICATGESCESGRCQLVCPPPLVNCGGQCVETNYNPNYCGACGSFCDEGQACLDGQCYYCDGPVAVIDAPARSVPVRLDQNTPNPFNPSTRIHFWLGEEADVSLEIYDLSGRLVRVIASGVFYGAGTYFLDWNGTDEHGDVVSSGVYVYRLTAGKNIVSKRLTLLK